MVTVVSVKHAVNKKGMSPFEKDQAFAVVSLRNGTGGKAIESSIRCFKRVSKFGIERLATVSNALG